MKKMSKKSVKKKELICPKCKSKDVDAIEFVHQCMECGHTWQ